MKHELGDEPHSIRACVEACSAGGPGARWEDGRREKQHRKEKTEKWKTRAEIRKEAGTKKEEEDKEGRRKIVWHLQDINHRVGSCRLP